MGLGEHITLYLVMEVKKMKNRKRIVYLVVGLLLLFSILAEVTEADEISELKQL